MAKNAPPKLVISLAVCSLEAPASGRSAYWLSIVRVQETLGVSLEELNDAVTYSVATRLWCGLMDCRHSALL